MPAHDSLRPDDSYSRKDARTATIEPDEQGAVDPSQMKSTTLVPQDQDFGFQLLLRLEVIAQHADEQKADCNHSAIMF